jgi:hypothetical protein
LAGALRAQSGLNREAAKGAEFIILIKTPAASVMLN